MGCYDNTDAPMSLFPEPSSRVFQPGDRVRGSFDPATVIRVEGSGRNARVLVEWDATDAAGVTRLQPRRTWRQAWTLTPLTPRR
jgi:hypothetical protein